MEVKHIMANIDLPKLPVARAIWEPKPSFADAARRWIEAGGAHHAVYAQAIDQEFLDDYATIACIELVDISKTLTVDKPNPDKPE
jgi:L-arabinose isomerase